MSIQSLRLHELPDFIASTTYRRLATIPISPQRAWAQYHHPRAQPDDVVLLLYWDENADLMGYLGILPDVLVTEAGRERVAWMSCIWVSPAMRGKGVAKQLLAAAFDAWGDCLMGTEFTATAKSLYDGTGRFADLPDKEGLRCYLRPNLSYLLPAKSPKLAAFRWLWKGIDACLSIPNALRLATHPLRQVPPFGYAPEVDAEAWNWIQSLQTVPGFNRELAELQWITRYPWLVSGGIDNIDSRRYHFSTVEAHFSMVVVKIYNNENTELIGVLMLAQRGKNLKIPYAYFAEKHTASVVQVIYAHLYALRLDMLTTFHPLLIQYFKTQRSPFFALRRQRRLYIAAKPLAARLSGVSLSIQDGDADAAFT